MTSDPFAGFFGFFGVCIDGGWVPIGHPLASDYLGRPLVTDYAGIYTLRLIAGGCTGQAPDVVKRRVYTARVEQIGATLRVFLSGADFLPGSNSFSGVVVSADVIRFDIFAQGFWDYGGFEVAENIAGIGEVVVSGNFSATTGIFGARMNSAVSENEGFISLNTATGWQCALSRIELMRQ
jgi:hypothetical protein